MRFVMLLKADKTTETGVLPTGQDLEAMSQYNDELVKAGVLLEAAGLQPSSKGTRITFQSGKAHVTDGPFAETKELIAGYTMIQVKSKDEALAWTRRFPNPAIDGKEAQIEVRQLFELEDFGQSEAVERFRDMDLATNKS